MIIYRALRLDCPCCDSIGFDKYFMDLKDAKKYTENEQHSYITEVEVN